MSDKPKNPNSMRVTSLFAAKEGGRVGSIQGEYLQKFIETVVKPAWQQKKAITFFAKVWKKGENPVLSAMMTEPFEKKEKPAEEDPFAADAPESPPSEEVPF